MARTGFNGQTVRQANSYKGKPSGFDKPITSKRKPEGGE